METSKPELKLSGTDGNAFAIMGKVQRVGRGAGWDKDRVDSILKEMQSGDYDNLLQTAMKYFEVS